MKRGVEMTNGLKEKLSDKQKKRLKNKIKGKNSYMKELLERFGIGEKK
jgi:hypothetical protein